MKCLRHGKETEYQCQWCGKQICELCVGKKEGKKIYCHNCAAQLSGIKKQEKILQEAKK